MMAKRKDIQNYAAELRRTNKFEYDSDEECDDGTWEHKLRRAEMEATKSLSFTALFFIRALVEKQMSVWYFKDWACKMTEMADEKHHIGDFLPPTELKKFMETYQVN
jgi:splicing factor 4